MIKVENKLRHNDQFSRCDVIIEFPIEEYDGQLMCDLMNECPGQFTYYDKNKFSFVRPHKFNFEEFLSRIQQIYQNRKEK